MRVEDSWAAHTGAKERIFSKNFSSFQLFGSKSLWLYNIPDTHKNSHGHIFFSLPPTHCTWIRLLLTCHPHNLHGIFAKNPCVLFTLGARCISCYFCSQCLTSAVALTDVKRGLQVNIQHLPLFFVFNYNRNVMNRMWHNSELNAED